LRPNLSITPFTETDIEAVAQVLRLAFKVERDYHTILKQHLFLQPEGALVARLGGRVVGFGAATIYGPFSYIALMGTHPEVQRQGVGRLVLDRLVDWIRVRGCHTILLDASAAGQRLYEDSGFEAIDTTVVFRRERDTGSIPEIHHHVESHPDIDLPAVTGFDTPIFGADRSRFLQYLRSDLPGRFFVSHDHERRVDGYLVAQRTQTLGPWVASNRDAAEKLLSRAMGEIRFENSSEVFVSGSNAAAIQILGNFGFKEQRRLQHMRMGGSVKRERATKIFGQASLGLG
jgi:ribosomal protein S18 acetylase RimI-like enzyme